MSFPALKSIGRTALVLILAAAIIGVQVVYDAQVLKRPAVRLPPLSFQFIKTFNLGLDSAMASYMWINTIIHLPFLRRGYERFLHNLDTINRLDPKFSFPYAFTVLVLPTVATERVPNKFDETIRIAKRGLYGDGGIPKADADWQIPFYLAVMYLTDLKDKINASIYFDIAAKTPGAPPNIKSVSINFGTATHIRQEIKNIWMALYEDAPNEETKQRAKNYVIRLEILELLERALEIYTQRHDGMVPFELDELVRSGILTEIPKDPYNYEFFINEFGNAAVKPPKL